MHREMTLKQRIGLCLAAFFVGIVLAWRGRSLFQVAVAVCAVVFVAELILI